jgi:hypothetical protein
LTFRAAVHTVERVRNRWLTPGAIKVHLLALFAVGVCLAAFWWQLHRALGGHTRSWAYTVMWPLFAAYAGWMWWRLLHEEPEFAGTDASDSTDGSEARAKAAGATESDDEAQARAWAAYNEYLAGLRASHDRPPG